MTLQILMLAWIKRVGWLTIILSSAMIIIPYAQWYLCQAKPIDVDQSGVGFRHCSYSTNDIAVIFLLTGNIMVISSFIIEKMRGK